MLHLTEEQIDRSVSVLKAMANPSRYKILSLLRQNGEMHVTDIQEELGISQSAISQYLATLRLMGLVKYRNEGVTRFYDLNDEKVKGVLDFFNQTK